MAIKSTSTKIILKITSSIFRLLLNLAFYILVVTLIISLSKKAYQFTYQIYGPVSVDEEPGRDFLFQIKPGESTMDISHKLLGYQAIMDKNAFFVKVKLQKINIMPGTYELNSSMTYNEIIDIISDYSASIIGGNETEE